MKTLFLIDANSLIHRCFHALPKLTSKNGEPTQALYGVSSILIKIIREDKPNYIAALFDRPEPTFRKREYPEYKSQRPKAPDELVSQIIEAHNLFSAFGIKTFEKPGFEADDLIGILAKKFYKDNGLKIIILTGDLDSLQIVDDNKIIVRILKRGISDTSDYDEKAVIERYGLNPSQLVDYKALIGDQSDNIKGVPGIGPKTASELLKKYKNIEGIYSNLDKLGNLKNKLVSYKKQIHQSRDLVKLRYDADIKANSIKELRFDPNFGKIKDYFGKFNFWTLEKRIDNLEKEMRKNAVSQISMF